jgi:hypothetical protein
MNKVYILALFVFMGQTSWAQMRDFQTSRLNSTAGTGVGSVLSTEAAILNPASSTFFEGSSFSYQTYRTSLKNENEERLNSDDSFPGVNKSQGLFLSDHSGPTKGGIAYITQKENNFQRELFTLHGAVPIANNASFGVRYNYIQSRNPKRLSPRHEVHHQASLGTTYIVDEDTVLGLVVIDPTHSNPGDERVIGGFQYDLADRFMILGDVGAQYSKNVKKYYLWRAALQINIFSDLFLRAGRFYDNITYTKGTGWGISWMGPRIGIEFAQKISEAFAQNSYLYKDEIITDTSLSAIIKF